MSAEECERAVLLRRIPLEILQRVKIKVIKIVKHINSIKITGFFGLYFLNKARLFLSLKAISLSFLPKYFLKLTCIVFAGVFFICISQPITLYAQNYSAQRYLGNADEEEEEDVIEEDEE